MEAFETFEGEPCECELYARFAYHLIVRDYHAHPLNYERPQDGIKLLRKWYAQVDNMMLDTFLCAYQYLVARGVSLKFARTAMIERARKGLPFRAVVFVDYKAQRRGNPRIT